MLTEAAACHGTGMPVHATTSRTTAVLARPGARLVYEMSAVLARRIPGAQYHVVAGAGHMINMEQPAAVRKLLIRFLIDLGG